MCMTKCPLWYWYAICSSLEPSKTYKPHIGNFGARHSISLNLVQQLKALSPMTSTEPGIVTVDRQKHSKKALLPIAFTESPIITDDNLLQP